MENAARGGGVRERRGSARDCVGGTPAQAPGSVHRVAARSRSLTAPAALAAASGSLRAGHRLPFPSGGGGGRSLSSGRPLSRPGGPAPRTAARLSLPGAAVSRNIVRGRTASFPLP